MNSSTLRTLGVVVLLLVGALVFVEMKGGNDGSREGDTLLPGLRDQLNEITTVRVSRSGEEDIVISKASDRWVVATSDDFAANVVKVREVLTAMADARSVEAKTANPDLHNRLGVDAPDVEGNKGALVVASVGDTEYEIVFGNVAQGSFRYARLPNEDQSWLIDQNPDIPAGVADWLNSDIIDIESNRIRAITISHPDGEVIRMRKESETDTDFEVLDIPDGRELSYATVANGIGGVLNDLDLTDVNRTANASDAVLAEFETFDGLKVSIQTVKSDSGNWISLTTSKMDSGSAENVEVDAESESDADSGADTVADVGAEAEALNARFSSWQYGIADHKANLLTRRWDDILKAEEE